MGQVYTFGLGVFGQLGHGSTSDERYPRRVQPLVPTESEEGTQGERIVQTSCGYAPRSFAISHGGVNQLAPGSPVCQIPSYLGSGSERYGVDVGKR